MATLRLVDAFFSSMVRYSLATTLYGSWRSWPYPMSIAFAEAGPNFRLAGSLTDSSRWHLGRHRHRGPLTPHSHRPGDSFHALGPRPFPGRRRAVAQPA